MYVYYLHMYIDIDIHIYITKILWWDMCFSNFFKESLKLKFFKENEMLMNLL